MSLRKVRSTGSFEKSIQPLMLPTLFHNTPLSSFSVVLTLTEAFQNLPSCTRHHVNILQSISFRTGSSYWTVNGSRIKGRSQKITSFGFPASVDHIDAAVYIPDTGHTLFFTQDQYWRYDINVQESCIIVCTPYLFRVLVFLDTMRIRKPWRNRTHASSQMISRALSCPSVQLFISTVGKFHKHMSWFVSESFILKC